jgi:hypothetical protein
MSVNMNVTSPLGRRPDPPTGNLRSWKSRFMLPYDQRKRIVGTVGAAGSQGRNKQAKYRVRALDGGQQPQAPPQHPPPPAGADPAGRSAARPPIATVDRSFTVSSWPWGQLAGADASAIGRLTSKVSPHARQRNS